VIARCKSTGVTRAGRPASLAMMPRRSMRSAVCRNGSTWNRAASTPRRCLAT
jgi:hypothetical protein